jgi:hypothetical protein
VSFDNDSAYNSGSYAAPLEDRQDFYQGKIEFLIALFNDNYSGVLFVYLYDLAVRRVKPFFKVFLLPRFLPTPGCFSVLAHCGRMKLVKKVVIIIGGLTH